MAKKVNTKLSSRQIMDYGQEVAATWGAVCTSYKYAGSQTIRYFCNEHGEEFYTDIPLAEIEKNS